jgi:hypothetical protein
MGGFELRVVIVDAGDRTIKVGHSFYGVTEAEARTYFREHLSSCSYFQSAKKDGRLLEELFELEEDESLPTKADPFPSYGYSWGDEDEEDEYDEEEEYREL